MRLGTPNSYTIRFATGWSHKGAEKAMHRAGGHVEAKDMLNKAKATSKQLEHFHSKYRDIPNQFGIDLLCHWNEAARPGNPLYNVLLKIFDQYQSGSKKLAIDLADDLFLVCKDITIEN